MKPIQYSFIGKVHTLYNITLFCGYGGNLIDML